MLSRNIDFIYRFYAKKEVSQSDWFDIPWIRPCSQENTCGKVSFLIRLQNESTASDLSRVFSWRFLAYFILTEKWNEKRKYPVAVQIFTFLLEDRFDWRQRFQKKFDRWLFDKKNVFKGNLMLQFSCLEEFRYGKSFWVVNTWRAPVQKWLKGPTLNFAHTFLTDNCTKMFPRFS